MRILVTGSRDWDDRQAVAEALIEARDNPLHVSAGPSRMVLVHGGCPRGADAIADHYARTWGWTVEVHPADWARHGKAAGMIRNTEMVDAGADLCLAFFQPGARNSGTGNCVVRAKAARIPVRRYPPEPQLLVPPDWPLFDATCELFPEGRP